MDRDNWDNPSTGTSNAESQANSYVDHVSLYRISGIGLSVTGTANDSGPYSNIIFDPDNRRVARRA